ncbi:MAG: histidine phosphatase family protein [Chloroflexi bacterium]|nr:histidine phosphatase family protein [Chloroflexota bacterium]
MEPTNLLLIRHGQTEWNSIRRCQGQTDTPLNERGIEQAQAAAEVARQAAPHIIVTSDLRRCAHTAEIIAEALGVAVVPDKRLREWHQGVLQGLHYPEIEAEHAELQALLRREPLDHAPEGGESLAEMGKRVIMALDDIAQRYSQQRVLVVTHELPIAYIQCLVKRRPFTDIWDVKVENGVIIPVEWPQPTLSYAMVS